MPSTAIRGKLFKHVQLSFAVSTAKATSILGLHMAEAPLTLILTNLSPPTYSVT